MNTWRDSLADARLTPMMRASIHVVESFVAPEPMPILLVRAALRSAVGAASCWARIIRKHTSFRNATAAPIRAQSTPWCDTASSRCVFACTVLHGVLATGSPRLPRTR